MKKIEKFIQINVIYFLNLCEKYDIEKLGMV